MASPWYQFRFRVDFPLLIVQQSDFLAMHKALGREKRQRHALSINLPPARGVPYGKLCMV